MPGNPDEFLNLLKSHYREALQYCRALCRDTHEAQDLLQQSLVQALEKLPGLREPSKFKSWFFTIITRTFYSQCRKKFWRRFLPLDLLDTRPELPAVFDEEPADERRSRLLQALALLKPKERAALLLFELGGFGIPDIAKIQEEKSLSAVKSRLSRTRQKLKNFILTAEKRNYKIENQTGDLSDETEKLTASFTGRR